MTTHAFPDLRASVVLGPVADEALAELPGLYGSLFSTREWFAAFEDWRPCGVCRLDDPRHVLVLGREGAGAVRVYNKTFAMEPVDAERACRAIFRAMPGLRRIHLNVSFPPGELRLPSRELGYTDHYVIDLPPSMADYEDALGKSTRRNLRLYENRLRRAHPDVQTTTFVPGDQASGLLDLIVEWKIARFSARGRTTYWETREREYTGLLSLLSHLGEAQVTAIDGRAAAIVLLFFVGDGAFAQEWAHDPRYESLHLGFVTLKEAVRLAIDRGSRRMDLLWGNGPYKERFGATPRRNTSLSVFPSSLARLYSLGEAGDVAARRARQEFRRTYWDVRHRAGRVLRAGTGESQDAPKRTQKGEGQ